VFRIAVAATPDNPVPNPNPNPNAIPEPGTLTLTAAALAALFGIRRKPRRQAA
jgi:hypothetical protein